jgi:hypothetical protein
MSSNSTDAYDTSHLEANSLPSIHIPRPVKCQRVHVNLSDVVLTHMRHVRGGPYPSMCTGLTSDLDSSVVSALQRMVCRK